MVETSTGIFQIKNRIGYRVSSKTEQNGITKILKFM